MCRALPAFSSASFPPMARAGDGPQVEMLPGTVEKLKGKGLISRDPPTATELASKAYDDESDSAGKAKSDSEEGSVEVGSGAYITADTRLNAVIIRDREERMPFYEEVIRALDEPAGIVQIQATIMDISTDYLYELGVQWRFREEGSATKLSDDSTVVTEGGLSVDDGFNIASDSLVVGTGFNFATIIGNAAEYLLAKVRALEEDGNARVLSEPSVVNAQQCGPPCWSTCRPFT